MPFYIEAVFVPSSLDAIGNKKISMEVMGFIHYPILSMRIQEIWAWSILGGTKCSVGGCEYKVVVLNLPNAMTL